MPHKRGISIWKRARKQVTKVLAPHLKSGYIAKVEYQQTVDSEGRPDWVMLYVPGPKARAEYRAFTRRGGPTVLEAEPLPWSPRLRSAAPGPSPLEAELIGRGVTPAMAGDLVRDHDEEKVRAQIEQLDWLVETKPKKVADPAAWLVAGIRNGHAAPKGFVSKAERQRREEARQAQEREAGRATPAAAGAGGPRPGGPGGSGRVSQASDPGRAEGAGSRGAGPGRPRGASGLRRGPGPVPRHHAAGPGAGARGAGVGREAIPAKAIG